MEEIEKVELALKAEKAKIDDEKARIKAEKEAKETARVNGLLEKLASVGFQADPFDVGVMDSESFEKLLAQKTEEFKISEDKRLAEEAKLKADLQELEKLRAEKAKMEETKAQIDREIELQAIRKDAADKATKETEDRIRREAEEKAAKESADAKRLAEVEAYRAFLASNGVTKDTEASGKHKVMKEGNEIRIYALIDTFVIPA